MRRCSSTGGPSVLVAAAESLARRSLLGSADGFRRVVLSGSQRGRGGRHRRRPGLVLAAISVLLQIVATSILHPPGALDLADLAREFTVALDEHALCLSGDRGSAENPSDQTPKPAQHESGSCCFWHGNAAIALTPGAKVEPVAFARWRSKLTASRLVHARRLTGAIGARAPPISA
jgi:hypothetical protein